jgi:hypothetical protein
MTLHREACAAGSSAQIGKLLALALCALSAGPLGMGPVAAFAAPSNPTNAGRLDRTVRFLQEAQNPDGGFGSQVGGQSSQLFSAWVALALAAAAINPQDQAKPGGASVYAYLTEHVAHAIREELCGSTICTTAFERELLVVDASGTSPRDFGGIDLLGELLARKLPDGSFPFVPGGHGEVNDTIFAILSLSPIAEPVVHEVVRRAAEWVVAQQNTDGSWSWQNKGSPGESDMTGAAIEALNAAGMPDTEAQQKAIAYLHSVQRPDGGFPEFPGEAESNSGSTAWATQGIWAAGENPEAQAWIQTSSGRGPLDYLESMQQPDGHIRYRTSEELNGVWMTAYAGPAYAAQPLPPPAPPRNPAAPVPSSSPGQGGEGSHPGGGVIAGGGGNGAPLFSRPQPRSKGHTAGGARLLESKRAKTAKTVSAKRHRNPGPSRKTPVPTVAGENVRRFKQRSDDGHGRAIRARPAGSVGAQLAAAGAGRTAGDGRAGEREVKGVLLGALAAPHGPGAPGLRSAGAGRNQAQWLTVGIAGALLAAFLLGVQLEWRRPETIL